MPFAVNTTYRHAFVASLQFIASSIGSLIISTFISLFFGITLYIRACLSDVKTIFDQMDKLCRTEKYSIPCMIEYVNEAIVFHCRITWYGYESIFLATR